MSVWYILGEGAHIDAHADRDPQSSVSLSAWVSLQQLKRKVLTELISSFCDRLLPRVWPCSVNETACPLMGAVYLECSLVLLF